MVKVELFLKTKQAEDVTIYFNSEKIPSNNYIDGNDFIIEIKNVPTMGQLTINCKGKDIEIDAIRLINDDLRSILVDLKIETYLKESIDQLLFGTLPIDKKRIELRKLKKQGLSREYLDLFLKLLDYMGDF